LSIKRLVRLAEHIQHFYAHAGKTQYFDKILCTTVQTPDPQQRHQILASNHVPPPQALSSCIRVRPSLLLFEITLHWIICSSHCSNPAPLGVVCDDASPEKAAVSRISSRNLPIAIVFFGFRTESSQWQSRSQRCQDLLRCLKTRLLESLFTSVDTVKFRYRGLMFQRA
jgi:hypothetical protein